MPQRINDSSVLYLTPVDDGNIDRALERAWMQNTTMLCTILNSAALRTRPLGPSYDWLPLLKILDSIASIQDTVSHYNDFDIGLPPPIRSLWTAVVARARFRETPSVSADELFVNMDRIRSGPCTLQSWRHRWFIPKWILLSDKHKAAITTALRDFWDGFSAQLHETFTQIRLANCKIWNTPEECTELQEIMWQLLAFKDTIFRISKERVVFADPSYYCTLALISADCGVETQLEMFDIYQSLSSL